MKTRNFRDLQVWQRSMRLAREIYLATGDFPPSEAFGLTNQIRRAASSIPANIAEGQGRGTDRSFALFIRQARGSLLELETHVELAQSLGWLSPDRSQQILQEAREITRMLNGLLRTLRASQSDPS
jgi:four helix bundle protein